MAAMYAMCTLGTSWNCFFRYEITAVTRENGCRREPYPPTTVSLLTNPRVDLKSARTTRIIHLTWLRTTDRTREDRTKGLKPRSGVREATAGRTGACRADGRKNPGGRRA